MIITHCMDIYSSNYSHQCRVELPFELQSMNGVSSVKDIIIIAEQSPAQLYVYSWSGQKLTREDLGLEEDSIFGIGQGGEACLQVATGVWWG